MSAEPTARYRRSRTRSRNVSPLPALALSQFQPHEYDLNSLCTQLVCPHCKTWVPITGINSKKPKLVPHDTAVDRNGAAVRCMGSHRLVVLDVTREKWERRRQDGVEPSVRRAAAQHRKPQPMVPTPVVRLAAAPATQELATVARLSRLLAEAHAGLVAHRGECRTCDGRRRCREGVELEYRLAEVRATVTARRELAAAVQRRQDEVQRLEAVQQNRLNRARVLRSASATDRRRGALPCGEAPLECLPVPETTLHPQRRAR
ncbi:hypothetical protein [Streptomyces melanogenes]|uniref:hypothetical protein n=1 Tax=Streptomyces melanogenes TaxID=67326 RepID=UPI0037989960